MAKTKELAPVVDYGALAGQGLENVDKDHLKVPFLVLLQDLSPETKKVNKDRYVEGAEPGLFINSVTKEVYGSEVTIIPCCIDHCWVEWKKDRGGFVARHEKDSQTVVQAQANSDGSYPLKTKNTNADGETIINVLEECFYVAALVVLKDGTHTPVIYPCRGSKANQYKIWMTPLEGFQVEGPNNTKQTPPLFAHQVRLEVFPDNFNNHDFFNARMLPANGKLGNSLTTDLASPLLESGCKVRDQLGDGTKQIDYESTIDVDATSSQSDDF